MADFREGEYIIYQNGDRFEIGKIKRLTGDGAFVWYHEGETASKTPFDHMHKIMNGYAIRVTYLGGADAIEDLNSADGGYAVGYQLGYAVGKTDGAAGVSDSRASDEFDACPFCGGRASYSVINERWFNNGDTLAFIQCLRCHARKEIRAKNPEAAREKARIFWNGRAGNG